MSIDLQEVFLRTYPDKILSRKCHDVDPEDPDLPYILDKMVAIMMHHDGVGLAAPQVGIDWNVFIVRVGEEEPRALVNPQIVEFGENKVKSHEGCLSLPGVMGKLDNRYEEITINTCLPNSNERMTVKLQGEEAIIFQHEYDHLQGRTLFDKMKQVQRMMSKKKYLKNKAKHEKMLSEFKKLHFKKEQIEQIVKNVEEAKHGKQSSKPKSPSVDGPNRNDSGAGITTANTSESNT